MEFEFWRVVTELGYPTLWVYVTLLLVGIYVLIRISAPERKGVLKRFLTILIPSIASTLFLVLILKTSFYIERPCVPCFEGTEMCDPLCIGDSTFPSGHSATIFAVATSVFLAFRKRWFSIGFIIAGLVAASRVVLGVHYISDVIVGSVLGVIVTLLSYKFLKIKCESLKA